MHEYIGNFKTYLVSEDITFRNYIDSERDEDMVVVLKSFKIYG